MNVTDSMKKQGVIDSNGKIVKPNFEPLWDYILMKPIKVDKVGSIHLPSGTKLYDVDTSVAVACGPGTYQMGVLIHNPVKVGDIVYHAAQVMPTKVLLNGELYLLLAAHTLMGIAKAES